MGSSGSTATGGEYTKKLYFDPEVDRVGGQHYWISDQELRDRIENLVDASENIRQVYVYRTPLYNFQLTDYLVFHAFLVFETVTWWWSIEKNNENVTIQRSKKLSSILYEYRRVRRVRPVRLVMKAAGRGSVRDLIEILWRMNHLNKGYDIIRENCKYFAANVFNHTNSQGKKCTVGAGGDLPH